MICLLIGYFFYGILNEYEVYGFFITAMIDFLPIPAVVIERNHDILRLQPQEYVFLYWRHRHDS